MERVAEPPQAKRAFLVGEVRHEDDNQALAVGNEIAPFEMALRFAGPLLAER